MDVTVDTDALRATGAELVVLFGSRARGRANEHSDADIGVLCAAGGCDLDAVHDALRSEAHIDVVALDDADPLLLHEVAVDGRPLYVSRPGAWEEFRLRAFKLYWDTQWFRDLEARTLRRRFA
jgi:predicted nucleotidyltransferase